MDEKDIQNNNQKENKLDWKFCPICGKNLPKLQNLKFCTKCGTDLNFVKEHKRLPPSQSINHPFKNQVSYPQYKPRAITTELPKISEDELIDNKAHKLWSTSHSIGVSLLAFLIMNGVVGGYLMAIVFITRDINILYDLILNNYFLTLLSLFEVIFIIVPVIYVRRYLRNPTLKNSLILLGCTWRGYDKKDLLKEILIGLSFAFIGVLVVTGISIGLELFLEAVLKVEIVQDSSELSGAMIPTDIPSLIIFSLAMLLVIGTSEEILFRGFMQKGLMRNLGDKWGIIVTALIFSMIHLLGILTYALESMLALVASFILSFPPYFAISMMLGGLYYWRNENLIANMTCHGAYNVLTIILAYLIYVVY